MARPRIRAGELGTIQITRLVAGSYRARARARDDAGTLHQLVAVANTEDAARVAVQRKAEALSTSMLVGLTGANTIAEAGTSWLEQVRARAIAGSLTFSTYESYETTVRCILVPQCGGITLDALTVGRCDRIIQAILLQRSVSAARRARAALAQICGYAVRDDAIRYNPVRDVQRLPLAEKKTSILTPAQIAGIRELMQHWRETPTNGPRPDYRALIDGMDIMLGTSARVGECIGLRRCDVDMTTAPPTVLINVAYAGFRRSRSTRDTRSTELIELLGLDGVGKRSAVGGLSYGVQRRVSIALALAGNPRYLLLDEPAAGLNEEEGEHLSAAVRRIAEAGVGVILVEHDLELVGRTTDRVVVLATGSTIFAGSYQDAIRDRAVVETYLGKRYRDA